MILAFVLTMPNNNAWNGKWSGDGKLYADVRPCRLLARANRALSKGRFTYNFGDGWRAAIAVSKVTAKEARKLRKESKGFCGYEWMIESILVHGEIYGPENPQSNQA